MLAPGGVSYDPTAWPLQDDRITTPDDTTEIPLMFLPVALGIIHQVNK